MKIKLIVFFTLLFVGYSLAFSQQGFKSTDNKDKRMEWWREARFGMFIHWGLYSIPAGQWKEEKTHAEWIRETAKIPIEQYEKLLTQFNPVMFNAEVWVKYAKDAGMKYIVLTSKHHDGFCLFDSKYTEFNVMHTPFKRDILKELADACRKYNIKICWYHSIMDWHHPDYLPRREWEKEIRPENDADFNNYLNYLKNELTEILTNYGDISLLWFDGEWEPTWNHKYAKELYDYLRNLKPDLIINNRIDTYRNGMGGFSNNPLALGDYGTPEQEIPENGLPGVDWESCMTMNDHWGFNKFDNNWKSTKELIQNLTDIASKGGNYLLNVGPTAEGLFPQASIDKLAEIGKWMKINGESIYGTKASPFSSISWGKCTQKEIGNTFRLYFHLFDWPKNKKIEINTLENEVIKAYLLSDSKKKPLVFKRIGIQLLISLPEKAPDANNSVVVIEIKGKPQVITTPEFIYTYNVERNNSSIDLKKKIDNEKIKIHFTTDGKIPTLSSPLFSQNILLKKQSTFKALSFYGNTQIGEITQIKLPLSFKIKPVLKYEASEKYNAKGVESLTDGELGSKDFADKSWLGFEGVDFNATLDLGKLTDIHHFELQYLVANKSWIFQPTEILVEASVDGIHFKTIAVDNNKLEDWQKCNGIKTFVKDTESVNARYVRFQAKNRGVCPPNHPGEGGKAWVFVNEIVVD
ncbi:MAG: alpha-L-fucosidase [Bacteroidales bacterium]